MNTPQSSTKPDFPTFEKDKGLGILKEMLLCMQHRWSEVEQRLSLKGHVKKSVFGNALSSLTFVLLAGIVPS